MVYDIVRKLAYQKSYQMAPKRPESIFSISKESYQQVIQLRSSCDRRMVSNRHLKLESRSGVEVRDILYKMRRQVFCYQGQKTGKNDCLSARSHLSTNFVCSNFVRLTNNKQPVHPVGDRIAVFIRTRQPSLDLSTSFAPLPGNVDNKNNLIKEVVVWKYVMLSDQVEITLGWLVSL